MTHSIIILKSSYRSLLSRWSTVLSTNPSLTRYLNFINNFPLTCQLCFEYNLNLSGSSYWLKICEILVLVRLKVIMVIDLTLTLRKTPKGKQNMFDPSRFSSPLLPPDSSNNNKTTKQKSKQRQQKQVNSTFPMFPY